MFMKLLSILLCFVFGASSTNAQTSIKTGAARVNITPSYGTLINGDFLPMFTKIIHDFLYAKALFFDNGKKRFVFVVVDCMGIDADKKDNVYNRRSFRFSHQCHYTQP